MTADFPQTTGQEEKKRVCTQEGSCSHFYDLISKIPSILPSFTSQTRKMWEGTTQGVNTRMGELFWRGYFGGWLPHPCTTLQPGAVSTSLIPHGNTSLCSHGTLILMDYKEFHKKVESVTRRVQATTQN